MSFKLFEPRNNEGNSNDPYMINKKGIKVQVPEGRVMDLLKEGFVLVDRKWHPARRELPEEEVFTRIEPLPISELREVMEDTLGVTEI